MEIILVLAMGTESRKAVFYTAGEDYEVIWSSGGIVF